MFFLICRFKGYDYTYETWILKKTLAKMKDHKDTIQYLYARKHDSTVSSQNR